MLLYMPEYAGTIPSISPHHSNAFPRFGVLRTLSSLHLPPIRFFFLLTHTPLPVSTTVITTLSHIHTINMATAAAASRACRIREYSLTTRSLHMHQ